MALQQIKFAPGIDKQDTSVGAVGRWVDSDNVRFRYGLPEKVGGWQSLLTDSIVGVARKQHAFVDTAGNRYIAIGTDKFLLVYFEGQLFDITPFRCNNAGVVDSLTSSTLATNSTTAKTCTITTTSDHDLSVGYIVELSSVTLPSGTGLNGTDFELNTKILDDLERTKNIWSIRNQGESCQVEVNLSDGNDTLSLPNLVITIFKVWII